MAKIGKEEEVCDTKRRLRQKERRSRSEKKEVICLSKGLESSKNSLTHFLNYLGYFVEIFEMSLLQLHWKQSHEEYHKYKKEDSAPVSTRLGHIRFEPLDEEHDYWSYSTGWRFSGCVCP